MFNDHLNFSNNIHDNLFIRKQIETYKNLCERMDKKINRLQKLLSEVANTDASGGDGGKFGTPEPVGDSDSIFNAKYEPTIEGDDPPPIGGSINEDNWQQMLQQIQNAYGDGTIVPSWWNPAWGNWITFYSIVVNYPLNAYLENTSTESAQHFHAGYNNLMQIFQNGSSNGDFNFNPPPNISWPFPTWPTL